MSPRNLIFAAWAVGSLLLANSARADESPAANSAPATNRPAFKAKVQAGETFGTHQMQRVFLNSGTNQIVFTLPTDFSMDAVNPQKIVLTQKAMRCFITVSIDGLAETHVETSFYKETALSRYPGARITRETTELVANHAGTVFDLEWINSGGVKQTARIVFVPTLGGILELSVLARGQDFKDAKIYFNSLASSVQTNESGKLVIVPVPDFS